MNYDFTTVLDRDGTGSTKWNQMKRIKPDVEKGIVPFSVADMEFQTPPEIVRGLQEYLEEAVIGYMTVVPSYVNAVTGWMERRHGWKTDSQWLVNTPGVVNALYHAVNAFTCEGDGVIIMTPVYYPFYSAVEKNHRHVVRNPLINRDGHYEIDFEDLEKKAKEVRNTMLILCSPHNPVGRVWTREELEQVGRICIENQVFIVSDEIHCDLIMPGFHHTTFASISDIFAKYSMTCIAPSKTFNLAGMQSSNIFIPDPDRKKLFLDSMARVAQLNRLSVLGFKACEIAYTQCEEWLEQVIQVIDTNRKKLTEFMKEYLPQIQVIDMEGTYLQWMDFRKLGWSYKELEWIMRQEAQIFWDEGYVFGPEGENFERMNIACPTEVMMNALERLKAAVIKHL